MQETTSVLCTFHEFNLSTVPDCRDIDYKQIVTEIFIPQEIQLIQGIC